MRRAQDESASTAVQANSAYANAQMDMPTKIRTVTLGEDRRDRRQHDGEYHPDQLVDELVPPAGQ